MDTMDTVERGSIDFQYSESEVKQLIKVVGVGGGGGNAVSKMFTSGSVAGVSFLLCNTDEQALRRSSVKDKIMIGPTVTKGLGAGAKPERAREAALESKDQIREALLAGETRMVFITAGMGGGTGTGAAPVIGKIAMEAGLLTIGIVTIPFIFEGMAKINQALEGVRQMRESVDALLVINNQELLRVYTDYTVDEAFTKADDTLSNAARGISDLVNITGTINLDFADVDTTLRNGGVAVINTGYAEGEDRMTKAIQAALNSPLLNNNEITKARQLLINVYQSSDAPMTVKEITELQTFTEDFSNEVKTIYGTATRDDLGKQIAVTILAAGFDLEEDIFRPKGAKAKRDPLDQLSREKQLEEQRRLIERTYGTEVFKRPKAEPVALTIDELDDEELILILENTPSIERDLRLFEVKRREKALARPIHIANHSALGSLSSSGVTTLDELATFERQASRERASYAYSSPVAPPQAGSMSSRYDDIVDEDTTLDTQSSDEEDQPENVIRFTDF